MQNNEIKEILDYLQENSKKDEATKQLVDYINNLQQENERLKEQLFDFQQHIYIEKAGIPSKLTKDKTFMDLYDMPTYEDYKSRIEKAVEYIKLRKKICERQENMTGINILVELLNILNGKE